MYTISMSNPWPPEMSQQDNSHSSKIQASMAQVRELWKESDANTHNILAHPWLHLWDWLSMKLFIGVSNKLDLESDDATD